MKCHANLFDHVSDASPVTSKSTQRIFTAARIVPASGKDVAFA
jgi:hypothetical protein